MPERHTIPVDDGQSVAAVHHAPVRDAPAGPTDGGDDDGDAGPWIVFCHGLVSDMSGSYERRCERAVDAGYHAVRFDARGCGASDGAFVDSTLSARIADLRAVLAYFDPSSYLAFGSSFGCKTALHATADDDRLVGVVGRAPVTYGRTFEPYREVLEDAGEIRIDADHALDGRFLEDLADYPFEAVADELAVPVAIFHGADDATVPFEDSLEATAALDVDVRLQKYAGEGHRFSAAAEQRLLEATFDWLASVRARE